MITEITFHLRRILYAIVFIILFASTLMNIAAISAFYASRATWKLELQKKDVLIRALQVSCEQDWLIKQTRPDG